MFAISHVTPAPFTQQVARALLEGGHDIRLFTTLTPDGRDFAARLLKAIGAGKTRNLENIPAHVASTYPWRELVRLTAGRIWRNETFSDRVFHWARDGFDSWVAGKMKLPIKLVYSYETECLLTFKAARDSGIRTVLDLPSPEHDFVENLLREERKRTPDLETPARARLDSLQPERTARRHNEFHLADVVCANSTFTRDTWVAAGLDGRKIITIPLGAPTPDPSGEFGGSNRRGPLSLAWAGTFSVRKGAHYLLDAWKSWQSPHAILDVYGTVTIPSVLTRNIPDTIKLHGPIPRPKVLEAFCRADALVFPTLCDGFGLVVNEALSRGLPVITTRRAGASDLIQHGKNGLLIEPGSSAALVDALQWCADNRARLQEMRAAALAAASCWQWSHYRATLRNALLPKIGA